MSFITLKLQKNGCIIHPKDVIVEVQADHDIDILYSKAWRAKEYAQNLIYGDPWHSFSYCRHISICLRKRTLEQLPN